MNWMVLLGSLAAVLAVAGAAALFRLGNDAIVGDASDAANIAEAALPGFEAELAWPSVDHRSAIVIGRDGSAAVIRPHGARPIARRLVNPQFKRVDQFDSGGRVDIETGDRIPREISVLFASRSEAGEVERALKAASERAGGVADTRVS